MSPVFRPVELFIGGIRTIIIDPHNEILPFWFREALSSRRRLIAVRIDAHHDMFQCSPALPACEGRGKFEFIAKLLPALQDYSRYKVNEGNFTCPGFHYEVIGALYHFHPGKNRMEAYGRVCGSETEDAPKTARVGDAQMAVYGGGGCGRIVWVDGQPQECRGCDARIAPRARRITLSDFKRDLQDCELPVAIGFDLDGLYGNEDRGPPEDVVKKRLDRIVTVIRSVSRPAFICLARSQTPRSYVPQNLVDRLQEAALGLINDVYGKRFPA